MMSIDKSRIYDDARDGEELTEQEIEKLNALLDKEDKSLYAYYKHDSGAWWEINVWNYDDDIIDVEIVQGIQNGITNTKHSEDLKIDRATMEWIN